MTPHYILLRTRLLLIDHHHYHHQHHTGQMYILTGRKKTKVFVQVHKQSTSIHISTFISCITFLHIFIDNHYIIYVTYSINDGTTLII